MEAKDFFDRVELLDLPELTRRRPDWTDRLLTVSPRSKPAAKPYVRWHWSQLAPAGIREIYTLWKVHRRYRRNIEQIEIDEINEIVHASMHDDSREHLQPIREKHEARRETARFLVATTEWRRLESLAQRWDVDASRVIHEEEANEQALRHVRRGIRDARWLFIERCAKTLIPILSLFVALVALLLNFFRHP